MANHTKVYGLEARKFDSSDFQDESVKRILTKLSDLERAALPEKELIEVRQTNIQINRSLYVLRN